MYQVGFACVARKLGRRKENTENVIDYFTFSLLLVTKVLHPEEWGTILHKRGTAYRMRLAGERDYNIEKASHVSSLHRGWRRERRASDRKSVV